MMPISILYWHLFLVAFGILISALQFTPHIHSDLNSKSDDDQVVDTIFLTTELYLTIGLATPLVANFLLDLIWTLFKRAKSSDQERFLLITRAFLYSTIIVQSTLLLVSDEDLKTYIVFLYRIQRYLLMSTCISCLYGLDANEELIKMSSFLLQGILFIAQLLLTLTHFVDDEGSRVDLLLVSFSLNIIVTAVTFGLGFYLIKNLIQKTYSQKSLLFLSRAEILYAGYLLIMFLDAGFWLNAYDSANRNQVTLLGVFSGKIDSTYNDFALCLLVFAVLLVILEIFTARFDDFNTKVSIFAFIITVYLFQVVLHEFHYYLKYYILY